MISTSMLTKMRRCRLLSFSSRAVITIIVAFAIVRPVQAQRAVVLIHGFASNPSTWDIAAQRLRQDYNVTVTQPDLPSFSDYETQSQSLITQVGSQAGDAITIGHSNGGIAARQANADGRPWGGLITIGTPHTGAPLAANALNGNIFAEGRYLANSIATPLIFYSQFYPNEWFWDIAGAYGNFMFQLGRVMPAMALAVGFGGNYTVLPEMVPGSPFLANLNGANLDREVGAIPKRFSMAAYVPDAWGIGWHGLIPGNYKLYTSIQYGTGALYYFAGIYYEFFNDYNDPYWYPKQLYAALWFGGGDAMFTFDNNWCDLIGAVDGYNRCTASDGIIPTDRAWEPNNTLAVPIPGPSHQEETGDGRVYAQIARLLKDEFGVSSTSSGGGSFGSVTIAGPSSVYGCTSASWIAQTNGGAAPFTYQWTAESQPYYTGTSNELDYTNQGLHLGRITVTATDANGLTATSSTFTFTVVLPGSC